MQVSEFSKREVRDDDRWLFKEPVTLEQLAEYRKNLAEQVKEHWDVPAVGGLTCDGCDTAPVCTLAFDAYNTDGDCLLSK